MRINLRKWDKSDISAVADIERECFFPPWNERMLLEEFENPNYACFIAETSGENPVIAGYAGFYFAGGELDISNIAVRQIYRKNKIASLLLEKIIETAKGKNCKGITLEVNEINAPAIALYEKYGFVREGIREKYYGNKYGALLLRKYIQRQKPV